MAFTIQKITKAQADSVRLLDEGQFHDLKSREKKPADLTQDISAFANADGGDLYIGITDKERRWDGFANVEAANGFIQCFEDFFPLSSNYQYEFLSCPDYPGLVLHVQVLKTQGVCSASNKVPYIRRGAQSIPQPTSDQIRRLELSKGIQSFETEIVNAAKEVITESSVTAKFIQAVVPTTTPEAWLRKQGLIRDERPTVGGVLLFAEEPQAMLPKNCGVKVYRYKTVEVEGFRDVLDGLPLTVEGHLYNQIQEAVRITKEITERIPVMVDGEMESVRYPEETLHEILTNAVLHRDYSIKDDIHIRIFDNRVEVNSPGRLPAHITPKNILEERFARNGALVRIMNKFPNPPNKDVGEGLNTAYAKMREIGLKPPHIADLENAVLVLIKHEQLAQPEQTVLDYLQKNPTIKNGKAREITHVKTDFRMKAVFNRLEEAGKIEKVPGTRTSSTAYRLKAAPTAPKSSSTT